MVSKKGLAKFKELYQEQYGVELNKAELFKYANQFLNFYRAVFKEKENININHGQKIRSEKN